MTAYRSNPLRPIHASMIGRCRVPTTIGTMDVTPEQREACERVAVETFTDMVNAGQTFQAALAAIYVSGMVHALEGIGQSDQIGDKP